MKRFDDDLSRRHASAGGQLHHDDGGGVPDFGHLAAMTHDHATAKRTGSGDPPSLTVCGVTLTAAAGDREFRLLEAALSLAELIALRRTAAEAPLEVAAVLGREAVEQGVKLDTDAIVAGRLAAAAYVAWVAPQPAVAIWTAALAELAAATTPATLPATTIATLRSQVATLPPSLRGPWYQVLHDKAAYDNQRDNTSSIEKDSGGTCNLTAVSMALEGMGYDVDPDALIETVLEKHPADNTEEKQQARLKGSGMREAVEATSDGALTTWQCSGAVIQTEAFWTTTIRAAMQCGHGVFLGARAHVIRVQRVDDDALVVDDPNGRHDLATGKWGEKNYRAGSNDDGAVDAGADNRWPFADGAIDGLKWVRIIAPQALLGSELAHAVQLTYTDEGHLVMNGAEFVID